MEDSTFIWEDSDGLAVATATAGLSCLISEPYQAASSLFLIFICNLLQSTRRAKLWTNSPEKMTSSARKSFQTYLHDFFKTNPGIKVIQTLIQHLSNLSKCDLND